MHASILVNLLSALALTAVAIPVTPQTGSHAFHKRAECSQGGVCDGDLLVQESASGLWKRAGGLPASPVTPPARPAAAKPVAAAARPVSAGKPVAAAARPVSAGKPVAAAARPVSAGKPVAAAARPVAQNGACPLPANGRKGSISKRAISASNAPSAMTIIINGRTYNLVKNCDQGLTGICYRLADGTGFAKASGTAGALTTEIANTRAVGLLIDSGTDTGCNFGAASGSEWMIVRRAPGFTLARHPGFQAFKRGLTKDQCNEKAEQLANVAFDRAEVISDQAGILHRDIHPGNVIFADNINFAGLTDANTRQHIGQVTLIDWSSVRQGTGQRISAIQRRGLAASFKAC